MKYIITKYEHFIKESVILTNILSDITTLNKFSERKKYADANFKCIGKGTGRYVYSLNDKYVLKLAKNKKGIAQNLVEINIHKTRNYDDITANIIEYDINGVYTIQEKAHIITEDKFKDITRMQLRGFLYYLRHNMKWDGHNHIFYDKVNSLIKKFDLDRFDVTNESSWGIINNNVVLVDYGLNLDIARNLYGVQY